MVDLVSGCGQGQELGLGRRDRYIESREMGNEKKRQKDERRHWSEV